MKMTKRFYRVDRKEIGFIKFIIEAYEGVAVFSTIDAQKGTIIFKIAPGQEDVLDDIIADLKKQVLIEPFKDVDLTD